MENANPPPTNNRPALPAALCARTVQELHELQLISAFVDSRLESIERFINDFANQPNETNMNYLESNDESVDTPLVSPFPHSDNESDDGEVLNELIEYENVGMLHREKVFDNYTFQMPRTIPRFKRWGHVSWSKILPILVLSQRDLTNSFENAYEKEQIMVQELGLNLGPEY
ncbi:hypothetical protein Tco_1458519 [Tanacetum coccineum]